MDIVGIPTMDALKSAWSGSSKSSVDTQVDNIVNTFKIFFSLAAVSVAGGKIIFGGVKPIVS